MREEKLSHGDVNPEINFNINSKVFNQFAK
jgi:hypothetical protein